MATEIETYTNITFTPDLCMKRFGRISASCIWSFELSSATMKVQLWTHNDVTRRSYSVTVKLNLNVGYANAPKTPTFPSFKWSDYDLHEKNEVQIASAHWSQNGIPSWVGSSSFYE